MLSRLRGVVGRLLTPVAKGLLRIGLSPDAVTILGTLGVVVAALWLYPAGHLFAGTLVIWFFAMNDLVDGLMARLSGRSGPWGAFLDSTLDRFADGAVFTGLVIWLAGQEVSRAIRTERAGESASRVAAIPAVRAALVDRQHAFAMAPGLVADGRDMGTVIFPGAALKIFLTASADERARRRHKQLKDKGLDANLAALSLEIAERDRRDANRPIAPLKPADDAVIVDSTAMSIEQVVARVLELAAARFPRNSG